MRGDLPRLPLRALFTGARRPVPAYAGGVALGFRPPEELVAQARELVGACATHEDLLSATR